MIDDYIVIVPVYNEENYLQEFINSIGSFKIKHFMFINDGSIDKTEIILKENNCNFTTIHHVGKGYAARFGVNLAIQNLGKKNIILMDGDGQHSPEDINDFLESLDNFDFVIGVRFLDKNMPIKFRIGNKLFNLLIKMLIGKDYIDTQCGFRAFKSKIFKDIEWKSDDYFMETEMLINAYNHKGIKTQQLVINTIYHDKNKGTGIYDGLIIFFKVLLLKLKTGDLK